MRHTFIFMAGFLDVINQGLEYAFGNKYDGLENTFLERWFTPGAIQRREFGQQVALQENQNEWQSKENEKWNDERNKFARLKELGINDLTIAQGLAGSSSSPNSPSSAGGVPSTPEGIKPSDVAGLANAATGGAASLAEAAFKRGTLEPTISNLNVDVENKLSNLGLTNEQIYAWKVDNKYRESNAQADLRIKALNEKNLAKEWEVMHSEYELNTTRLDTELSQQKLNYETAKLRGSEAEAKEAEAAYLSALKSKTEYEGQFAKIRVDFWKARGFDILASSTDMVLVQRLENGQTISEIVKEMSDYYGSRMDAEQNAIANHAYEISRNENLGKVFADWKSRPNSIPAFVVDVANRLANSVRDGKKSLEAASTELQSDSKFKSAFYDFKGKMKIDLEAKRKAYKEAKRTLGKDAAVQAWNEYQKALSIYDEFDEDEFSKLLLNQY